jgi:hypothetical protein
MPDSRARHYWDGREAMGRLYETLELDGKALSIGVPAWDVWMLFDRDTEWKTTPPKPAWWEHQLHGLPEERHLDPERFAAKAKALAARAKPKRPSAGPRGR